MLGRPLPNHWDFGIGAAGAFKGSIATGLHLDHHDEPETHSCVASISIGDSGFQDLLMHVPQLRLLAPCDDGELRLVLASHSPAAPLRAAHDANRSQATRCCSQHAATATRTWEATVPRTASQ